MKIANDDVPAPFKSQCIHYEAGSFVIVEPAWSLSPRVTSRAHIGLCFFMTPDQADALAEQLHESAARARAGKGGTA